MWGCLDFIITFIQSMETNKLYIGGIPWVLGWQDIKDIFREYGEVNHVKIIKDRETWKSKWYGFIEFETVREATLARDKMNGIELEWRVLKIEFAEEKVDI